jgi:hypothetical protein
MKQQTMNSSLTTDKHGWTRIFAAVFRHFGLRRFSLLFILHFAFLIFNLRATPTNNPTAGTYAVTIDTNSVLVGTSTNLFKANSNLLIQAGAAGPQGPTGATGATGPQGPAGTNNNIVAGTGLNSSTNGNNVTVGLTTPIALANGGTGAITSLLAASNVGTMFVGTGGFANALAATPSYTGQLIISSFGEVAGAYGVWLAGSTSTGDVTQAWQLMGGATIGSPYSESPYTPGNQFWYLNGNPASQLLGQSNGDAVVCFVNMNPWQSGSGACAAMVTTNTSLASGGAISTNSAGVKIYMRDQFAEYLYATAPEAAANNAPGTVGLVANAHRQIFSEPTVFGSAAQSNGNYIWIESIPYGDASGLDFGTHFPLLVSGVHDVTNSANVDALYVDQQNDFVSVHRSLYVGYTSYFTNLLIASNYNANGAGTCGYMSSDNQSGMYPDAGSGQLQLMSKGNDLFDICSSGNNPISGAANRSKCDLFPSSDDSYYDGQPTRRWLAGYHVTENSTTGNFGTLNVTNGMVTLGTGTGSFSATGFTNTQSVNVQGYYSGSSVIATNYNSVGTAWRTNAPTSADVHFLLPPNAFIRSSGVINGNWSVE